MCLSGQGKRKMWRWRCLISQLAKPGCYQQGRAEWILLPLVKWAFCNHVFFSNGRCWIFHWLSMLAKRRRGVGAASFFWRGREKTLLNTLEEDDWWVLWVYFSAWKLTVDLFFTCFSTYLSLQRRRLHAYLTVQIYYFGRLVNISIRQSLH